MKTNKVQHAYFVCYPFIITSNNPHNELIVVKDLTGNSSQRPEERHFLKCLF